MAATLSASSTSDEGRRIRCGDDEGAGLEVAARMSTREPILSPVKIRRLRPTQMTVGLREVEEKRRQWRAREDESAAAFLGRYMIPVLRGPKGRPYVIDHHHLVRALHEEGVEDILVNIVADLSALKGEAFWI